MFSVSNQLPPPLKSVWLISSSGDKCLGCLVNNKDGYYWAKSQDIDVAFWEELPPSVVGYDIHGNPIHNGDWLRPVMRRPEYGFVKGTDVILFSDCEIV